MAEEKQAAQEESPTLPQPPSPGAEKKEAPTEADAVLSDLLDKHITAEPQEEIDRFLKGIDDEPEKEAEAKEEPAEEPKEEAAEAKAEDAGEKEEKTEPEAQPLDAIYNQNKDLIVDQKPDVLVGQLFDMYRLFVHDPVSLAQQVVNTHRIRKEQIYGGEPQNAGQTQQATGQNPDAAQKANRQGPTQTAQGPLAIDPKVFEASPLDTEDETRQKAAMRQMVERQAQLETRLAQMQQVEQKTQAYSAEKIVEEFATEKDAEGNRLRPFMDDRKVVSKMSAIRSSQPNPGGNFTKDDLQALYEEAVWSLPETRKAMLEGQNREPTPAKTGSSTRQRSRTGRFEASPVPPAKDTVTLQNGVKAPKKFSSKDPDADLRYFIHRAMSGGERNATI